MAGKKKYHRPKDSIMGRSDVPLVERMRVQHELRIAKEREQAAKLATYAKRGMKFLLEEMEKIGFEVRNGRVQYYLDEEDNVITKAQAARMDAAAMRRELDDA